jgi:hypothetical protein
VEWISTAWKEVPASIIPKTVSEGLEMEHKMTFSGTIVNKVAGVLHLQKMKVRLKGHWTNFLIKYEREKGRCVK